MKKLILSVTLILLVACSYSQKDQAAVKILDKFSSLASSAPSVSMKFELTTTDQAEGTTKNVNGSIILDKDKYRLDLDNNIVWFNGETSWSYLPEEKEVTISKPDKSDNTFQAKPSSVFSMYRKGYKIKLIEETTDYYMIDLYPEDIKSDNIRIRLKIGKPSYDLKNIEYKYRNGIIVTLKVIQYNLKEKPAPSAFVYPSDQYKGVEVIDMR